ncbi:hypothetical protein LPJ71_002010 [Coemansia sp. S17]|nr:hypothetical protein LPJ71_002010 [Coemansia sp. S17]
MSGTYDPSNLNNAQDIINFVAANNLTVVLYSKTHGNGVILANWLKNNYTYTEAYTIAVVDLLTFDSPYLKKELESANDSVVIANVIKDSKPLLKDDMPAVFQGAFGLFNEVTYENAGFSIAYSKAEPSILGTLVSLVDALVGLLP